MSANSFKSKLVAVFTALVIAFSISASALGTQNAFAHHGNSSHHGTMAVAKPGKCKITNISCASGSCTVKWKKVSGATSYEIKCTPRSGNAKTITKKVGNVKRATVSGLKSGVTYNVQIRACKTVNGTRHCGNWSARHHAKVKSYSAHHSTTHSSCVYITNTGSKFHASGCRSLKASKISISRSAAISRGYTACGICHP